MSQAAVRSLVQRQAASNRISNVHKPAIRQNQAFSCVAARAGSASVGAGFPAQKLIAAVRTARSLAFKAMGSSWTSLAAEKRRPDVAILTSLVEKRGFEARRHQGGNVEAGC